VTHLIAREASGHKYKYATLWKIKVVTLKWFEDSLERGMILDESLYDPLLPPEDQGVGAWNRSLPQVSAKREQPENPPNLRARKLRRVASTKLVDENEGIWGDIMGGGFEVAERGNPHPLHPTTRNPPPSKASPVIQEVKSFASETTVFDGRDRGPSVSEERSLDQPQGFLQNCYFFIYGFTPKQVSMHMFCVSSSLIHV
jgi:DNA replication regulator DPB11